MTDTERLDWLERHGTLEGRWNHQGGYILKKGEHVSGGGPTFREALDSLIRRHQYVREEWLR